MLDVKTFYLSRVLGRKVFSQSGDTIGRVQDILVNVQSKNPHIIAIKLNIKGKSRLVDFSNFTISKVNKQYVFQCTNSDKIFDGSTENTLYLKSNVLDK